MIGTDGRKEKFEMSVLQPNQGLLLALFKSGAVSKTKKKNNR